MSSDSVSEVVVLLYVVVVEIFEATLPALTRSGDNVCSGPESPAAGILKALEESVLLGIESDGRCVIAMLSLFLPKNLNMWRPIEGAIGKAGLCFGWSSATATGAIWLSLARQGCANGRQDYHFADDS